MKVIILTGTIGSGKSTASAFLRELGTAVIDSDSLGKEVIDPGSPGWQEVVDSFGLEILTPQGTIDRKKMAGIVFGNPDKLQKLNRIIHPRVDAEVEARLRKYREQGVKAVFVEMAILVGAPWMKQADEVWVVKVSGETAVSRLRERGMSESEVLARLANQPPPEEKGRQMRLPVKLIENDGSLKELKIKIEQLWREL